MRLQLSSNKHLKKSSHSCLQQKNLDENIVKFNIKNQTHSHGQKSLRQSKLCQRYSGRMLTCILWKLPKEQDTASPSFPAESFLGRYSRISGLLLLQPLALAANRTLWTSPKELLWRPWVSQTITNEEVSMSIFKSSEILMKLWDVSSRAAECFKIENYLPKAITRPRTFCKELFSRL